VTTTYDKHPPAFYFLAPDYSELLSRIQTVRAQIADARTDSAEGVAQSSESWHDNYVFEESQRQQKMLLNILGGLSKALEHAELVEVPADPSEVSVGVMVHATDTVSGAALEFAVGSYMTSDLLSDAGFISYEAPIAALVLGAKVGEVREGSVGGQLRSLRIERITPARLPSDDSAEGP
jgi:transcription elongation GreA/GreB family factor